MQESDSSTVRAPQFTLGETEAPDCFRAIQDEICAMLIEETGETYHEDLWEYEKGSGGGITRVWENGDLLEKAGVNFSSIVGDNLPSFAAEKFKIPPGTSFHACGVSLVIHPRNPHTPTIHMNIRLFQAGNVWWFGGGIDLTPSFIAEDDARVFHRVLRDCCERHGEEYSVHKEEADRYFYLPHRKEMRGIGGIFVDHLKTDCDKNFAFICDIGHSFNVCYRPLLKKFLRVPYTERERAFQLFRRGRYAEFNLAIDRGTKFGLASGGRTESILMSLPLTAQFHYHFQLESPQEEQAMQFFQPGRDWAQERLTDEEE